MVDVKDKHKCCGCAACMQACPKHCITMQPDNEGFLYPQVDHTQCIECGLCEKVCPCLHEAKPSKPLKVFAAINRDEPVCMSSSSGGIFTSLAQYVIQNGGVVFGARFDNRWDVIHDYTDKVDGLSAFRGSKYLQSRVGDTFTLARRFLKEGRTVLFSGTSCQIAALRRFLQKDYDNLLTADLVCHGTPSPLVWRIYLEEIIARKGDKNTVLHSNSPRRQPQESKIQFCTHLYLHKTHICRHSSPTSHCVRRVIVVRQRMGVRVPTLLLAIFGELKTCYPHSTMIKVQHCYW